MPSLTTATRLSKLRTQAQKRWPTLLAILLCGIFLLLIAWNKLCPDDVAQTESLAQHGWRFATNAPCSEAKSTGRFYQAENEAIHGEFYLSFSGKVLASPTLVNALAQNETNSRIICSIIQYPSFVEEIAYENAP